MGKLGRSKSVKVEGLKELDKALQTLAKATAKNTLRRVLKKSSAPLVGDMDSRAPEASGALKESVKYTTKAPKGHKPGSFAFAKAKKLGFNSKRAGQFANFANRLGLPWVEAFVGPGQNPQGVLQEFGTVDHPPQPFARPAWDSGKRGTLQRVTTNLKIEVHKSVKRAKAKALRRRK